MSIQDDYLDPDRHLWPAEEDEQYADAWKFLNELYNYASVNRDEEKIKRAVYKFTDCGAWINFEEDGIKLGSIVEGSDHGTEEFDLNYKDVPLMFCTVLARIEEQASAIWDWANVERENGKTDADNGCDWPLL